MSALVHAFMRLEDLAPPVGASAGFAALAAVMYFTRRIDWHGVTAPSDTAVSPKESA